MANMFGLIVSGRLVQTNFEAVAETRFVTTVEGADNINHIVVFLTGTQPFPPELGGSVYFSWPSPDGAPVWHLLGTITNQKPSAIFKISGLKTSSAASQSPFMINQTSSTNAQIGISVEPLTVLTGLTPTSTSTASTQTWQMEFSQAMCESLHNYCSSYSRPMGELPMGGYGPSETFIPSSTLMQWYNNFTKKLAHNANFWRK